MRTETLAPIAALTPTIVGGVCFGVFFGAVLAGCDPVVLPPFVPPRDTSYDADLDAQPIISPTRDAPPFDAPRPDTPELDAPEDDAGDPDFDGGTLLPITIDGSLDELEWETALRASSTAVGVGAFPDCTLSALRVLGDDEYIYVAIEATLCSGIVYLFADTGSPGVTLALTGLGDLDGEVDAALARPLSLVDPDFSPRFAWGTSSMSASSSPASDAIGWRELSQDGPHRHFTTDTTECGGDACETRVPRSALGFPSTMKLTARIGTAEDGSSLALPVDTGAGEAITTFVTVNVSP